MPARIQTLGPDDLALAHGLLDVFGEAFEEPETYGARRPDAAYLRRVLATGSALALVALDGPPDAPGVAGGLVAYDLPKLEQARSELYVYDLAVRASHRRRGIATALLGAVCALARARGAHAVFVQADPADAPAVALYESLGRRADVVHFDLLDAR